MSFFSKMFNGEDEENELPNMQWNHLEDVKELDQIVKDSFQLPVVIFKHSTRCSISRMALKQFEHEFDLPHLLKPYFLDLLEHRDISNEIAARFGVLHQSPQIILIKDGKAIFNASHEQINVHDLKELV
jgi:bacillithiol system protein YtxJ